ncbi:MAG: hypothetical protein ACI8SK_001590 [Shewanella sp.]|jgi:hypothetical protein
MFLAYRVESKKRYIAQVIFATVVVLILTLLADWLMFSSQIIQLWQDGFRAVVGVEVGIALFITVGILVINKLDVFKQTETGSTTAGVLVDGEPLR